MTYSEKLKDPRWQKRRLEVFKSDNFTCVVCGATTETLHVHHFKYTGDHWDATDGDLATFCESCHKVEHLGSNLTPLENQLYKLIQICNLPKSGMLWVNSNDKCKNGDMIREAKSLIKKYCNG